MRPQVRANSRGDVRSYHRAATNLVMVETMSGELHERNAICIWSKIKQGESVRVLFLHSQNHSDDKVSLYLEWIIPWHMPIEEAALSALGHLAEYALEKS